jgi:hypothetical protein
MRTYSYSRDLLLYVCSSMRTNTLRDSRGRMRTNTLRESSMRTNTLRDSRGPGIRLIPYIYRSMRTNTYSY